MELQVRNKNMTVSGSEMRQSNVFRMWYKCGIEMIATENDVKHGLSPQSVVRTCICRLCAPVRFTLAAHQHI